MKSRSLFSGISFLVLISIISSASAEREYLKSTCSEKFSNDYVNILRTADLNKDGVIEIIAGTYINGLVKNYKYSETACATGWSPEWSYSTKGSIKSMQVVDVSGDGKKEVLVNGIGYYGKTPDAYMFVITDLGVLDWEEDKVGATTNSVYAADLDGDGILEVIMAGQNKKVIVIENIKKEIHKIRWSYTTDNLVKYVKAKDLDGDGKLEVVAMSKPTYGDAQLYALSNTGKLKWKYTLKDGIYTAASPENVQVADLDSDGKGEVILGTYKHGVDVVGGDGKRRWNYNTQNVITTMHVSDVDGDQVPEVLVGSRPYIHVLDKNGKLKWKSPVNTSIYSMYVVDLDGDGRKDILIGSTRYIYILDGGSGARKGVWTYKEEIQGEKLFKIKDANARSISAADLDGDGELEVVVGFEWQEEILDQAFTQGRLHVFEVNKDYVTTTTKPTLIPGGKTTTTQKTSTTTPTKTTEATVPKTEPTVAKTSTTKPKEEGGGGLCCIPLLPAAVALVFSLAVGIPYALVRRK